MKQHEEWIVGQKKKPLARKPLGAPDSDADLRNARKRRNSWEPQVIVPHRVDLPLDQAGHRNVAVPATANGVSLLSNRL
jgi:hypothetical protein